MTLLKDFNKDSKDFFSRNFVHEKRFHLLQDFVAKPKTVKNELHFSQSNDFAYSSLYKYEEEPFVGEVKISGSEGHMKIESKIPSYESITLGLMGKRNFESKAAVEDVEIFAGIKEEKFESKVQLFPLTSRYIFNASYLSGSVGSCLCGAMVSGTFSAVKPTFAIGTHYGRTIENKAFNLSLVTGAVGSASIGNVKFGFFGKNTKSHTQLATDLVYTVHDRRITGSFGGKFILNKDPCTEFCGRVNTEGKLAFSIKQVLNPITTGTLGIQVDPKHIVGHHGVSYGIKLNLTT